MNYQRRLSGLGLLTGGSDAENARILAGHLREQQTSAASKELLLFSTCQKIFGGLDEAQSLSSPLWVALRETGLIETLLQALIKQELRKTKLLTRKEIDSSISEGLLCLRQIVTSQPWPLDTELHDAVRAELGEALKAIYLEYGLSSKSDPESLYTIQYLTFISMGFVFVRLGPLYILQDTTSATALTTLVLAVIFDPLAESSAINNTHRAIVHKQTRIILSAVMASQYTECLGDISTLVANKHGMERITLKCISYLSDFRYMFRCYTGLSLLKAMATTKSLHPKFINDAKVHLAILRWFWAAVRGPQEIIPEDDVFAEDDYDWSLLIVDMVSALCMIFAHLASDLRRKALYELVVEGDLIMALGRWFFSDQATVAPDDACRWFIQEIAKEFVGSRRFIAVHIEPTWRHVLKSLYSAKRSGAQPLRGDRAIQIWLTFGGMLGLVAHPDVKHSARKAPDFVKCSSLVCPVFGEYAFKWLEPDVAGLKCTRCQIVYCSLACQRTDWRSGRHQVICETKQSS